MKIEVGKRYIDAEGIVRTIDKFDGIDFFDMTHTRYESNGRLCVFRQTTQDLICEVVPEIITAWKEGYFETWKDVLQAHIDWWTPRK
jgi:hypothetical protein